jgi:hypothetical protein
MGVTAADAVEAAPGPATFVARTANTYDVPLARPSTVQLVAPVVVQDFPWGSDTTVNPVIGAPPLSAGATQDTVADPLPATAETPVAAPGVVRGITAPEGTDAAPLPAALRATTVNV